MLGVWVFIESILYAFGLFFAFITSMALIDRLLSKKFRKQIGINFKERLSYNKFGLKDILAAIDIVVWKDIFSFRFFIRTCLTSFISLAIIFFVQFVILGYDIRELFSDNFHDYYILHLKFLVFLIFSNFIVDYFSFTQTSVLLNLIHSSKSVGSVFIVIVCDFLASINIFVLAFAFFLYLGIMHVSNSEVRTEFAVWTVEIERDRWHHFDKVISKSEVIEDIGSVTEIYIRQLDGKRDSETRALNYDVKITHVTEKASLKEPAYKAAAKLLKSKYPSFKIERENGVVALDGTNQNLQIPYNYIGSINHKISEKGVLWLWYSQLYLLVDTVQDNFIHIFNFGPNIIDANSTRSDTIELYNYIYIPEFFTSVCIDEKYVDGCDGEAVLVSKEFNSLKHVFSSNIKLNLKFPIQTFLFTSLFMTFAVYVFITSFVLYFIINWLLKYVSKNIITILNLEEYPVTIIILPVAVFFLLSYFCYTFLILV